MFDIEKVSGGDIVYTVPVLESDTSPALTSLYRISPSNIH